MIDWLSLANRHICLGVVLLILAGGAAYSLFLGNQVRFLPDESDYFLAASNLAKLGNYSIDGVNPTAARPPGYPFVLAPLIWLGGDILAARLLNYVFFALAVIWLNEILRKRVSALAASLGVLMAAAYGVFFYTAGVLYPQTLCGLLLVGSLDLLTRPKTSLLQGAFAGALMALMILAVPTFAFVPLLLLAWAVFYRRPLKPVWASLLVMSLALGAWTWRNYTAFHNFTFISTHSGRVLLYGNSENTTPNAGATTDISRYEQEAQRLGLEGVEADRYFTSQAVQYVLHHPLQSAGMYVLKFINYFNISNELVTSSESSMGRDLIMLLTYGPLLLLLVWRLLWLRKVRLAPLEVLWLAIYIASDLVYSLFITRIRFRLPFDWMLILISASFAAWIISRKVEAQAAPVPA